jgi:hypothetical protein
MLSTSSGLAKLASSQQSISEGLVLHRSSSRPPGRYNAGEWISLGRSQQPKATSSSRWLQSSISPSGLRRYLSLPSPQPALRNSFGSKSSADLECPESSPLTTGSYSIAKISGSIVAQSEKLCFASVYHLQSNGAVERANGKNLLSHKEMPF